MLVLLVPSQVFISFDIQSACDFPCGNVSIHFGLKIKLFCYQHRPRIIPIFFESTSVTKSLTSPEIRRLHNILYVFERLENLLLLYKGDELLYNYFPWTVLMIKQKLYFSILNSLVRNLEM